MSARRFALLGHPSGYDHLVALLGRDRPDFASGKATKHRPMVEKLFEWVPPYVSERALTAYSAAGATDGQLLVVPFLPDWLDTPRQLALAQKKTTDACTLARAEGAQVIALGGFTSIIGAAAQARAGLGPAVDGVTVTSGNALTAALATAQLRALLTQVGAELRETTVAIVGATGDIGSACARALGRHVAGLRLIARNRHKLGQLASSLGGGALEIEVTPEAAARCHVIILATSSAQALLREEDLAPGTIVCDVGFPKTLAGAASPRRDVLVFAGGIAEVPFGFALDHVTQLGAPEYLFGCFTEAIVLALTGELGAASVQGQPISERRLDDLLRLAASVGARPALTWAQDGGLASELIHAFHHRRRLAARTAS